MFLFAFLISTLTLSWGGTSEDFTQLAGRLRAITTQSERLRAEEVALEAAEKVTGDAANLYDVKRRRLTVTRLKMEVADAMAGFHDFAQGREAWVQNQMRKAGLSDLHTQIVEVQTSEPRWNFAVDMVTSLSVTEEFTRARAQGTGFESAALETELERTTTKSDFERPDFERSLREAHFGSIVDVYMRRALPQYDKVLMNEMWSRVEAAATRGGALPGGAEAAKDLLEVRREFQRGLSEYRRTYHQHAERVSQLGSVVAERLSDGKWFAQLSAASGKALEREFMAELTPKGRSNYQTQKVLAAAREQARFDLQARIQKLQEEGQSRLGDVQQTSPASQELASMIRNMRRMDPVVSKEPKERLPIERLREAWFVAPHEKRASIVSQLREEILKALVEVRIKKMQFTAERTLSKSDLAERRRQIRQELRPGVEAWPFAEALEGSLAARKIEREYGREISILKSRLSQLDADERKGAERFQGMIQTEEALSKRPEKREKQAAAGAKKVPSVNNVRELADRINARGNLGVPSYFKKETHFPGHIK